MSRYDLGSSRGPVTPLPVTSHFSPALAAERTLRPTAGYIPHTEYHAIKKTIDAGRTPILNIYGLGGIGKSALIAKYCYDTERTCHYYDLRNAPTYGEVANWILSNVFKDASNSGAGDDFSLTERLRTYIANKEVKIVLIFDNLESIMGVGDNCGRISEQYSGYDNLFRCFITYGGGSSLVLSGRERVELGFNRNDEIKAVKLNGLDVNQTSTLLDSFQLSGSFADLSRKYLGNPLALKMAASTISEEYFRDIDSFLETPEMPSDLYNLYQGHFARLSRTELIVLLWLAIVRGPCSREELKSRVWRPAIGNRELSTAIRNLEMRCLIERSSDSRGRAKYHLQGVIAEFTSDYIIEQFSKEIQANRPELFHEVSLVDTSSREYVIDAQKRLLVNRISDDLSKSLGSSAFKLRLNELLRTIGEQKSYAAGNVINLYARIEPTLRNFDLANRHIVNADFRYIHVQDSDLTDSKFSSALLRNTYGTLIEVRYSHDDKFILGAATEFSVAIWDAETLQFVAEISEHHDWVRSVDSNSHYIVSGSNDEKVVAYSYSDRSKVRDDGAKHGSRVRRVRLSPKSEQTVYSSGDSGNIIGWNIKTDTFCELAVAHGERHSRCIWDFVFVNGGDGLVSVSDDGTVRLWDVDKFSSSKKSEILYQGSDEIKSITYDGSDTIFCGCDDGTILQIHLADKRVNSYKHFNSAVWGIDYCERTRQLVCGYDDGHVTIWQFDATAWELSVLQVMLEHSSKVWSVHFNRSGTHFVTSSDDFEFKVWDAKDYLPLFTGRGYTCMLRTLAVSDKYNSVIVAGDDHVIRKYALDSNALVERYTGHSNHVRHLDWSDADGSFLSAGDDGQVISWGKSSVPAKVFKGHVKRVWAVAHVGNGLYASVGEENDIYIWDAIHAAPIQKLRGHRSWIWDISYSPSRDLFATASEDGTCILWKYSESAGTYRRMYAPLRDHKRWLFAVAFSPSGKYLITCSADCTAIVYETDTGRLVHVLPHEGWVWSAVFIEEDVVVTGSADSKIRVWRLDHEAGDSQIVKVLSEHASWVVALGYSKKEKALFSASADWSAKRWSVPEFLYQCDLEIDKPFSGSTLTRVEGLTQAEISSLVRQGAVLKD